MKLPNFFIVGAPKSGTTAMADYLRQHPDIFMPPHKEIHFFGSDLQRRNDFNAEKSKKIYCSLFKNVKNEKAIGEASVLYLYSKNAAYEIKKLSPEAKIIIMLRNPVEMMYSWHSQLLFNTDEEVEDFQQALELEQNRKKGQNIPQNVNIIDKLFYRDIAHYSVQLERYIRIFGYNNVYIILFDEFKNHTEVVYKNLLKFLSVDAEFKPEFKIINPNKTVRIKKIQNFIKFPPLTIKNFTKIVIPSYKIRSRIKQTIWKLNAKYSQRSEINSELTEKLKIEFKPEIDRLSKIIGKDLSHWNK